MAGEFKIKNGLLLGDASISQPVTSITDSSSFTSDSSSLATVKAIKGYVDAEINTLPSFQYTDASLNLKVNKSAAPKYAEDYGLSTTASGSNNRLFLQTCVSGGGTVFIKAGTYEINDTIFLDSNTTIIGELGTILKKVTGSGTPFTHIFLNRGALTKTWNENIYIQGIELAGADIGGVPTAIPGLTGHMAFNYIKNLTIKDFICRDGGPNLFMFNVCNWENVYYDNIKITSEKDGLSFQTGHNAYVNNVVLETYDDGIGIKTCDFTTHECDCGDIYDMHFNNVTDRTASGQLETGNVVRCLVGSWKDFSTNAVYWNGEHVLNNQHLYINNTGFASSSTGLIAPTHTSGSVTGSDGITWRYLRDTSAYYTTIHDITFDNFVMEKNRGSSMIFAEAWSGSVPGYFRAVSPGTEGTSSMSKIIVSNSIFKYNPAIQTSIVANAGALRDITLVNNKITGPLSVYISSNNDNYLPFDSSINLIISNNEISQCDYLVWSQFDSEHFTVSSAGNIQGAECDGWIIPYTGSVRWCGTDIKLRNGSKEILAPQVGDMIRDVNGTWIYKPLGWQEMSGAAYKGDLNVDGSLSVTGNAIIGKDYTYQDHQFTVYGKDTAKDGIIIKGSGTNNPLPGSVLNSFIINPAGLSFVTDSSTLSSAFVPIPGVAISVGRATPALSIKNFGGGPAIALEMGGIAIGQATIRAGASLDATGDILNSWADHFVGTQYTSGAYKIGFSSDITGRRLYIDAKSADSADTDPLIQFRTGPTPTVKASILQNGNFGIGKLPSYPLDVSGSVYVTGGTGFATAPLLATSVVRISGVGTAYHLQLVNTTNGVTCFAVDEPTGGANMLWTSQGATFDIQTNTANKGIRLVSNGGKITLSGDGSVGLTGSLDVSGNIALSNGKNLQFKDAAGTLINVMNYSAADNITIKGVAGSDIYIGNSDAFTLKSGGTVIIGSATSSGSKLAVAGSLSIGAVGKDRVAPTNGLLVEGNIAVGRNDGYTTAFNLDVSGTARISGGLLGHLKEASLGTSFVWNSGVLDVSVTSGTGDVTKAYVDGSIVNFATNSSVNSALSKNVSIGSAVQTASNIGGEASIFSGKIGNDLQFRTIAASGSATVTVSGDTINIGINASSGGEVNTASNLGSGEGLFSQKVSNDLRFKSLKSTNNTLSFTSDVSHVYIDASLDYYNRSYVDGSLNLKTDLSYSFKQDTSLYNLTSRHNFTETSLYVNFNTNVSLGLAFNQYANASLGLAVNIAANASLGYVSVLTLVENTSIGVLTSRHNFTETSLGITSSLASALNSSLGSYTTKTYVDGSLSARDASWAWLRTYDDQRWIDTNRCGFVNETDVSVVFNETTYVLQLIRTGSSWKYMRAGIEYSFTTDPSVLVGNPPAAGMHYVVINNNNGTLSSSQSAWTLLDDTLPVATVFYNSSLSPKYHVAEEKHQSLIDRRTHAYLHYTQGTKYVSGGVLSGPTVNGATNLTNVFGVTETVIADEDMFETLPALATPDGSALAYTCFYRTNASTWKWKDSSVPYLYGTNNRIQWDSSSLVEAAATNNRWYNWYLLFTNIYGRARYGLIPGRAIFTTLALAQAEDPRIFDMTGFPIAESVIAYQFSWEYNNALNNQGKVRLGATPKKINVATITSVGSAAGFDHNALAGLQGGTTAEYYHLTSAQSTDFAGKTYVDGSISAALASNSSLGNLSVASTTYNSSIGVVTSRHNFTETSVGVLTSRHNFTETSLYTNFLTNASLGLAVNIAANASLGYVSQLGFVMNTSIGVVTSRHNFTETSVGVLTSRHNFTETSLGNLSNLVNATNSSLGGYVPYTGAAFDLSLGAHKITGIDAVQFNLNPTVAFSNGQMFYDNVNKTVAVHLDENITLQIGQETHIVCYNNTGSTITNGKAVTIVGVNGVYPQVAYALAIGDVSSRVIGLATQDISNGLLGYVTTNGIVHDISTESWPTGSNIYLSDTVPGGMTVTAPAAYGSRSIIIGHVLVSSATAGSVLVDLNTGQSLRGLTDVNIISPSVDQHLTYNGLEWVNSAPVVGVGAGVSYFLDNTSIINASTGPQTVPVLTLSSYPVLTAEVISTATANANTVLIDSYVTPSYLGGTQIDPGVWEFITYASAASATGSPEVLTAVHKNMPGAGTVSITGSGTVRNAVVSGGTPFLASDASTTVGARGWLQTSRAQMAITSFGSTSDVSVETLSTYTNESNVNYTVDRFLFQTTTGSLTTSISKYDYTSPQPAFSIDSSTKLSAHYYAKTSRGSNTLFSTVHNGTTRYSYFKTPLTQRHNNLAGLQGGATEERYHLTLDKYNVVQSTLNVNTGDQDLTPYSMKSDVSSLFASNASLGYVSQLTLVENTSIGILTSRHNFTETSLGTLTSRHNFTETSLYTSFYTNASLGLAFNQYTNVSLGLAFNVAANSSLGYVSQLGFVMNTSIGVMTSRQNFTETSLYTLTSRHNFAETSLYVVSATYIPDASLNQSKFKWVVGVLEPSVAGSADTTILDSSLYVLTSRHNFTETSLGTLTSRHNFTETSLYTNFLTNASLGLAVNITANASLGYVSQLGFVMNTSMGVLTSRHNFTETSLYTNFITNSSLGLAFNQYANASLGLVSQNQVKIDASLYTLTSRQNFTETSLGNVTSLVNALNTSIGGYSLTTYVDGSLNNIRTVYISDPSLNQSKFKWVGGYLEPSVAGGVADTTILDASLYTLTTRHNVTETSLGTLTSRHNFTETSLYTNFITNSSFGLAVNIAANASLGYVSVLTLVENTSIGVLTSRHNFTETSLYANFITNASLGLAVNIAANASLGYVSMLSLVLNTSMGVLTSRHNFTETSLYVVAATYIPDASLNHSQFIWNNGVIDVSVVGGSGVSQAYVDGSLALRDASLNNTFFLSSYVNTSSYYDGSISTLTSRHNITETSLGSLTRTVFDSSIAFLYNHVTVNASSATNFDSHGVITSFAVTADTSFGDACYVAATGRMTIAKADAIANANAIAMCATGTTVAAGGTADFLLRGTAKNTAWSWTIGGLIYLSATGTSNNTLTQTAPSGANNVVQILGVATSKNAMIFAPSLVQVEHT